jgi:hypothetical protein
MTIQPGFYLQAKPDFSSIWFPIGVRREVVIWLDFKSEKDDTFALSIERHYPQSLVEPVTLHNEDINALLYGVLTAIEIYTGLNPDRYVLCKSDDPIASMIFRIMLRSNRDVLEKGFSVNIFNETAEIDWTAEEGTSCPPFTLKRIADSPSVQPDRANHKYTLDSQILNCSLTVFMLIQVVPELN